MNYDTANLEDVANAISYVREDLEGYIGETCSLISLKRALFIAVKDAQADLALPSRFIGDLGLIDLGKGEFKITYSQELTSFLQGVQVYSADQAFDLIQSGIWMTCGGFIFSRDKYRSFGKSKACSAHSLNSIRGHACWWWILPGVSNYKESNLYDC